MYVPYMYGTLHVCDRYVAGTVQWYPGMIPLFLFKQLYVHVYVYLLELVSTPVHALLPRFRAQIN